MTHKSICNVCSSLGLVVLREPAVGQMNFSATAPGVRVYWSTSSLGGLLTKPRVAISARDTHARSLLEIKHLVKRAR